MCRMQPDRPQCKTPHCRVASEIEIKVVVDRCVYHVYVIVDGAPIGIAAVPETVVSFGSLRS